MIRAKRKHLDEAVEALFRCANDVVDDDGLQLIRVDLSTRQKRTMAEQLVRHAVVMLRGGGFPCQAEDVREIRLSDENPARVAALLYEQKLSEAHRQGS